MTDVAVAGGGPGEMVLAYLLARAGIPVTLLESRQDFDRDFRGDSLHPWTLELFDELGLADDLLALPHHPARYFRFHTPSGEVTTADYGKVRSKYPYVALMPQARFLDFVAERAKRLPGFELKLGAKVTGLLDGGGARYRDAMSASVQVFLTTLPAERVRELLRSGTITFPGLDDDGLAAYETRLRDVAQRGWAGNYGESSMDEVGVAAPVLDHRGDVVAAVLIPAPRFRVSKEQFESLGEACVAAAAKVTTRLGGRPAN